MQRHYDTPLPLHAVPLQPPSRFLVRSEVDDDHDAVELMRTDRHPDGLKFHPGDNRVDQGYDSSRSTHSTSSTSRSDHRSSIATQLSSRLHRALETLARDAFRSNAHSTSQEAKLLCEESEADDVVRTLEEKLREACDHSMALRVEISKIEERAQIRYLKFEVRVLNMKVWEHLLHDCDCREVYTQKKMLPRTTGPFGKFTHRAKTYDDWMKLKRKLEWIEKALIVCQQKEEEEEEKNNNNEKSKMPEEDATQDKETLRTLKGTLKLKADIIQRYNRLNEIVFEGDEGRR